MGKAVGTVRELSVYPWTSPQGEVINLHSFQLEGDGRWFKTGRAPVAAEVGSAISFNITDDGKNTIDTKSVAPVQLGEVAAAPIEQAVPMPDTNAGNAIVPQTVSKNLTKNAYWDKKDAYDQNIRQPRIEYQSARNAALSFVTVLLQVKTEEGLPAVPGITKSANAAKRLELIDALVEEYTQKFYEELPGKVVGEEDGS
jgi:hypothetical protein